MYSETFFQFLEFEKRFSKHTLVAYRNDLDQFAAFLIENYQLDNIDSATHLFIRSWIVNLMDQGISTRSINRKITTLKTYYKFQLREGGLTHNPILKVQSPKISKRLPVFVEKNNMDRLLEDVKFEDSFKGLTTRVILEFFYVTGVRISELINLKDKDIDLHSKLVKVLGKRNKERIVPLNDELLEWMEVYQNAKKELGIHTSSEHFFVKETGAPLYARMIQRMIKEKLSLVTTINKKSPHVLRHTFATHLLNNGAELNAIKELLGHSSLSATQVYTHNSIEKLKNIYKQAHPKS